MAQALYRKWRPQTWDEVVGQEHVIQTLRNAVRGERVGHAYLFAGQRGTGKTTSARLLAKAVNCLAPDLGERPCNQCEPCLAVNEGRFLDLIEIDAASNTSVEDVRDLRDRIHFSPNQGRYKVYIIDEVHMLSTAAFNALLKTLEEPPPHAIFVLATTEVHKIPATVLSRCQRHEFRRLPLGEIVDRLRAIAAGEGLSPADDVLALIARQATGSLRDAESLFDQLASMGDGLSFEIAQSVLGTVASEAVAAIAAAWAAGERAAGLAQINAALDAGADPRQLGRQLVDYLRDVLLVGQGLAEQVERGAETKAEMAALAETISSERLAVAIRIFSRATLEAGWNWQPGLPLELALVEASAGPGSPATPPAAPIADEQAGQPMDGQPDAGSERIQAQPDEHNKRITPAEEKPARIMHETGALTLANMQTRWREVLAALFRHDPRTQALVNSCKPLSVRGDRLVLGFSSEILRKKMEQGHNLELVRTALAEVFDQPLEVRCVIASGWSMDDEQATPPPMEDDGMVATALRDLGAQVVDVETIAADEDQEEQDT